MLPLLVVFVVLVAHTSAQFYSVPWGHQILVSRELNSPSVFVSRPVVQTVQKYHAQDELGQFAFSHFGDNQAREEVKKVDGTVQGAYSYVDPAGKLINVHYQADNNGFRILGANNLPVAPEMTLEPVKDTPEVAEARAAFTREFEKASRNRRDILLARTSELVPIEDAKTPASTKLAEIKEKDANKLHPFLITPHVFIQPGWTNV